MKNTFNYYQTLKKPRWAPPAYLFGPVWAILYILIAISFGAVFYKISVNELPLIIALPFILNLIFNFSFTYFQFKLKNNFLAAVDILLVLITLIWAMGAIFPYAHWITYANITYLIWVAFATVLQLSVTYLNR